MAQLDQGSVDDTDQHSDTVDNTPYSAEPGQMAQGDQGSVDDTDQHSDTADNTPYSDDSLADPDYELAESSLTDDDEDEDEDYDEILDFDGAGGAAQSSHRPHSNLTASKNRLTKDKPVKVSERDKPLLELAGSSLSDNDEDCDEILDFDGARGAAHSSHSDLTASKNRLTKDKPVKVSDHDKPLTDHLHLLEKKPVTAGRKQVYDKVHYCTFCGARIVSKISRHITTVHRDKSEVQEILLLPKQAKERRLLMQKLVNEGNFAHNIASIQQGTGEIVVGRRSKIPAKNTSDYVACSFCRKWQSKKNLWRHTKTCSARSHYYQADQEEGNGQKKRILAVKRGQHLVSNAAFSDTDDCLAELVSRMRDDEVRDTVMADELIRREAALRMSALGRKEDQKQDDIYRVSQAARTLGRIVLLARESVHNASLTSLIQPGHFDLIVNIGKKLSTDKEKPALNVGKTIGHLLAKVCDSKYCLALRKRDIQGQEDSTNFKKLLETEWNSRVNRSALRQIQSEKRQQLQVIPLTEDLQLFRDHLLKNIQQLSAVMKKKPEPDTWVKLAKYVMCRLIMFNKRRRAEVRELKVHDYLTRPCWTSENNSEMTLALSPVDRLLAKR